MIARDDVLLALSNSGGTAELAAVIAHAARYSVPLIAVTANADSPLAEAAETGSRLAEAIPENTGIRKVGNRVPYGGGGAQVACGPLEPFRNGARNPGRHFRILGDQLDEHVFGNAEHGQRLIGHDGGGPRRLAQQRQFTKLIITPQGRDIGRPVGGFQNNIRGPAEYDVRGLADFTLTDNHLARIVDMAVRGKGQQLEAGAVHALEKRD